MRLVNLTRQTIVVYDEAGESVELELPTDPPHVAVRFDVRVVGVVGEPETFPVVRHTAKVDPHELPEPEADTVFVVSRAVLEALAAAGTPRPDFVAPDTDRDSAVRDARGRVLGVRRFRVL